jgi:hypothetical protein
MPKQDAETRSGLRAVIMLQIIGIEYVNAPDEPHPNHEHLFGAARLIT